MKISRYILCQKWIRLSWKVDDCKPLPVADCLPVVDPPATSGVLVRNPCFTPLDRPDPKM